jgi:predicted GNAT family acetyltransferase
MKVEREENNGRGAFYIEQDGRWVGEMIYAITGYKVMTIYHTEVSDVLKGKHAGLLLVKAGVTYARENGIRIEPLCPFVKEVIHRDESLQDVLAG